MSNNYADNVAIELSKAAVRLDSKHGSPLSKLLFSDYNLCNSLLDSEASKIADGVIGHISFIRTTVTPLIRDIHETVSDGLLRYSANSIGEGFDIKVAYLPAVTELYSVKSKLERLGNAKIIPPTYTFTFPNMDNNVLNNYIANLPGDEVASGVAELYKNDPSILSVVFNKYVRCVGREVHGTVNDIDELTIAYFLSIALTKDIPENIDMTGSDYELMMVSLTNMLGSVLHARLTTYKKVYMAGGRLTLRKNLNDKSVVLIGENYSKFLADKGTSEVILGDLLEDNASILYIDKAKENSEKYTAIWNTYVTKSLLGRKVERLTNAKILIDMAVREHLTTLVDDESISFSATCKTDAYKLVTAKLNTLKHHDVDDLKRYISSIVTSCIFSKTDVGEFLDMVDTIISDNPDVSMSEVTRMAVISYVATYVSRQVIEYGDV